MTINLLSDEIINQIAAGEVIENPSAVVKELVENSIDANASMIDIEIVNYGFDKITIKDNGVGISKNDLLNAPKRHATSKIQKFSDLYNIKTMGFRGEALASIFSIANTKIISKMQNKEESFEISSKNINKLNKSGSQQGTTIIVENLFYNTPARKKYLRSQNIEFRSIIEIIYRYALYYNDIKFTLKHNSRTVLNKPAFKTPIENILYTLGKDLKNKILYLKNSKNGIKLSGFISNPLELTYSYSKNQYLYVNGRYIKSKLIKDAIYEGFSTNLMSNKHPFFVLYIDIDPEIIDVNVHPTKIEIKFENELEIFEFVKKSILNFLRKESLIKPIKKNNLPQNNLKLNDIPNLFIKNKKHLPIIDKTNNYFDKDKQKYFNLKDNELFYEKNKKNTNLTEKKIKSQEFENINKNLIDKNNNFNLNNKNYLNNRNDNLSFNDNNSNNNTNEIKNTNNLSQILKEYKIIGLLNRTYIILETPHEMFLLDFHACAEKIAFEKLIKNYKNKNIKTQKLIKPKIIFLDNIDKITCNDNLNLLKKIGFVFEEFGNNEILLREVPINNKGIEKNPLLFKDIITQLSQNKNYKTSNEKDKINFLARIACRNSIKAGYEMTNPEIKKLIENLTKIDEPFFCPHGRPTMIRFTYYDIEKKFKRIV